MKKCPFCAKKMQDEVIQCQHHGGHDQEQKTGQPRKGESAKRKRTSFWSWKVTPCGLLVMFLVLLIGGSIAIPCLLPAREKVCPNACVNKLRQIDAAKEQWALHNNKVKGDPVDEAEVDKYINRRGIRPKCPQGGTYIYGRVSEKPTCTLGPNAPHVLP